jgi:predicted HTH domain antitoxin
MSRIVLEMPANIVDALRVPPDEQEPRLRRELAVRLYQKGLLSFGKDRELVGLNKWEFHFLLAQEGITRQYDVDDLHDDLQTLDQLG